ncbi:hypothetical protein M8J76_010678 [Diaphorina citri]|nr:hypothetical protein M8J76_010678 [Diaphorina citri]
MEELNGILPKLIKVNELKKWGQTQPIVQQSHYYKSVETGYKSSPFPFNPTLNNRVILWEGDITCLCVDAVVHPTNENFTEKNSVSDKILYRAGPHLKQMLRDEIEECRTGDVQITEGFNLPVKYILHTVGPKYNTKYKTAAEITLHSCYRNVLMKSFDLKVKSIGISVINSIHKNYPPDEGAHIALRTIRRFLEKQEVSGRIRLESIVLVVESCDAAIYEVLMPLYFPRSKEEERCALVQLPSNLGGPDGEPIYSERQIRIIDNPQHLIHRQDSAVLDLGSHIDISDTSFTQMQGDLDQQRLLGERPVLPSIDLHFSREVHDRERYEKLLRRARTEDLSEVSGIGCLYQSGHDRYGRPVIVFVGKWFRFKEINLEKALLYLIHLLDPLVKGDYILLYFHTLTSSTNYPAYSWLREVYNILPYKYKKNLKACYIVHPTFWTKMMTWWFTTFMAPAIKQKVHSIPGVEYLYSIISPNQLEIPAFITEYDMTINGIRYFSPATTSVPGSEPSTP